MILTFQTSFPSVDEEERYADIDVPATRRVDDV
jgi:singapore isolate B (sub-type 7) whole genome shotgun sequence assembly, scaffold_1